METLFHLIHSKHTNAGQTHWQHLVDNTVELVAFCTQYSFSVIHQIIMKYIWLFWVLNCMRHGNHTHTHTHVAKSADGFSMLKAPTNLLSPPHSHPHPTPHPALYQFLPSHWLGIKMIVILKTPFIRRLPATDLRRRLAWSNAFWLLDDSPFIFTF